MTRRLLAAIVVVALGFGAWLLLRDRGDDAATTTTPTTTTTTAAETMPLQAFFFRGPGLVPVVVRVPKTDAVATAALEALLAGPPAGYSTDVPGGTKLVSVTVADGIATAAFSKELAGAPRTAQGQIVYTLTQFPSVKGVLITAGVSPVLVSNGAGETAYTPVGRETYEDLTPEAPIFVASPERDSHVSSPVEVSGTAMVFEANLILEVWHAGKLLATHQITATNGAPERGTFAKTLELAPGTYSLVLYEPSAADGSHLHTTTVDITVDP